MTRTSAALAVAKNRSRQRRPSENARRFAEGRMKISSRYVCWQRCYCLSGNATSRHCERSEAIHSAESTKVDCFVATLLAMTWTELCLSRIDVHKIPQQRIDFVVPLLAGKHAVMADTGLHVVHLAIGAHAGAEVLGCERLADRADVVLLALDRHQPHAPDRLRIDLAAAMHQLALRQEMLLEDVAHGLDVELRGQVHDCKILVVEGLDGLGLLLLALGDVVGEVHVLLDV